MKFLTLEKINILLLSLIPLSIIIGPSASLINLLILGILFVYLFKTKNFKFLIGEDTIKLITILYLYLVFNTVISLDPMEGIGRNLGFIRYLLLFLAINFIFKNYKTEYIFKTWLLVISLVIFDSFIEIIFGKNIFGWGAIEIDGVPQIDGKRLVSFFRDEPVVAAFLNGFLLILTGYLLNNLKSKNYISFVFPVIFILSSLLCILLTGERSNTIKIFLGFFLFIYSFHFFKLKKKVLITFLLLLLISIIIFKSDKIFKTDYLKMRFVDQIIVQVNSIYYKVSTGDYSRKLEDSIYINLYISGIEVFKNNPLLGVGNKNYRVETCKKENKDVPFYWCMTHPHQIYIEFLAEHGLVGTIILLFILFRLIFKHLRTVLTSKNYIQIGCMIYLITNFLPLLPTGSFFGDFNSNLFWINLSIMYACNPKTNVFNKVKLS